MFFHFSHWYLLWNTNPSHKSQLSSYTKPYLALQRTTKRGHIHRMMGCVLVKRSMQYIYVAQLKQLAARTSTQAQALSRAALMSSLKPLYFSISKHHQDSDQNKNKTSFTKRISILHLQVLNVSFRKVAAAVTDVISKPTK